MTQGFQSHALNESLHDMVSKASQPPIDATLRIRVCGEFFSVETTLSFRNGLKSAPITTQSPDGEKFAGSSLEVADSVQTKHQIQAQ